MPIHQSDRGDRLASGERSATFTGPRLHFTEGEMREDLLHLSKDAFIEKYRVAAREYDMLSTTSSEEKISSFHEEMQQRAEIYNRQLAAEADQDASLKRDCFLTPYIAAGLTGRVIVSRDGPADKPSQILIPRSMRKDKTLLPTTGHVIKETIYASDGGPIGPLDSLMGKRVLFSPMSGTAICFKQYPTWILLELSEILAIVNKEDAELQDETLEPLV
jgi:co-chaperonin GroES (HSP10)